MQQLPGTLPVRSKACITMTCRKGQLRCWEVDRGGNASPPYSLQHCHRHPAQALASAWVLMASPPWLLLASLP